MRAAAMPPGKLILLFGLVLAGTAVSSAQEKDAGAPGGRAAPKASAASKPGAEDRALLYQLSEAQRGVGEQLQDLQNKLESLTNDLASSNDRGKALEEEVKAMREEVKGLYWESSQVKQQIDAVKEDIGGLDSNLAGFRAAAGIFIAVMILLLLLIAGLTVRR
jgi:septal ring factor EnvC (AmiA/AmiB activator)